MGGGASSSKLNDIDNDIAAKEQNAVLAVAVEEFTEQAYLDGSKTDGLKLILSNPEGRKAFIKFLNTENGGENYKFFQDMEKIRKSKEADLAEEAKATVASYQKPAVVADEGVTDQVSANIESILANKEKAAPEGEAPKEAPKEGEAPAAVPTDDQAKAAEEDVLMQAMFNATNETMVIIALNVFPNFIGSQAYKDWREEEARVAAAKGEAGAADGNAESAATVNSTSSTAVVPSESATDSFANKSAQFINPGSVGRIFSNGSWIGAFVTAAEGLPICVTLADADPKNPNFPLLYVNKVFENTTQYPRERIRGTNCKFLQGPKTEPESIALLSNALANQQPVKVAITNYRADKQPFKNLLAMKPVFDLDGRYCYVVGVQFDISAPGSNAKAMKLVESLISLLPNVVPSGGGF
mmetsp:Transcript_12126/g.12197  ORF Transcript_12126/g.12197 Transcript_12126/m.12197 type:complete len:412 (-) Transcript_12126:322-1557(-)|eukprot:CAMPEP_0182419620 /NCGR_PEP_ID=MMETSP1167-20130531/4029_1 /TAXON_ID=2988 /ORGANISM="Mallomonas Sp, Strain CCMP3275" /LENGTH=411 /DNA_ID=CAMNT_0024594631 /DNA_START=133 /DNA_END=1368 /DNA_ORIENTATION=-